MRDSPRETVTTLGKGVPAHVRLLCFAGSLTPGPLLEGEGEFRESLVSLELLKSLKTKKMSIIKFKKFLIERS